MLNLAQTHDQLIVVNDQLGRPTWTRTLAEFMNYVVDNKISFGLYQLSNDGSCTWYGFAKAILKHSNTKVIPVTSTEYPQKAYRPRHSIMNLKKAKSTGFEIINWRQALEEMLKTL